MEIWEVQFYSIVTLVSMENVNVFYLHLHNMSPDDVKIICKHFTKGVGLCLQNLTKEGKGEHYKFWLAKLKQKQTNEIHLGVVPTQMAVVTLDLPGLLAGEDLMTLA